MSDVEPAPAFRLRRALLRRTALSPQLRYERATAIAQGGAAHRPRRGRLVLEQGLLTREQIDAALSPDALAGLRGNPV